MKHTFVLDENILYLAVKGTNEKEEKDSTSSKLLILILKNCHKIVVDKELNRCYKKHLKNLERISRKDSVIPGMESFVRNLLNNKDKVVWHFSPLGPAPDEEQMPRKDVHVVRTGYHFKATIVTVDEELAQALSHSTKLKKERVNVLYPREAVALAEET